MMTDYLYDGQGPPDPEVAHLEEVLAPLRYAGAAPVARRRPRWPLVAAAAATVALAAGAALMVRPRTRPWAVEDIAGTPTCGGAPCRALPLGQWLETDGASRARVTVANLGRMDVEPGTRVRRRGEHRLELAVGGIAARVTAPPRLLVVDTPTAAAVDLGCAYKLNVAEGGATHLEVTWGWVSLEAPGRSVYVPAGAEAWTTPGVGPSTPVFLDAPAPLREAVARIDAGDAGAVAAAIGAARARDTLSLVHLVPRVSGVARAELVDRILGLGPPAPFPRERLLAADAAALDAWRETLAPSWY
jgi:hypothetical protein